MPDRLVLLVVALSSVGDNIIEWVSSYIPHGVLFSMLGQSCTQTEKTFKNPNLRVGGNQTQKRFSRVHFAVVPFLNLSLLLEYNWDILFYTQYHITTSHNINQLRAFFTQKKYLESRIKKWLDITCYFSSQHLKVCKFSYFFLNTKYIWFCLSSSMHKYSDCILCITENVLMENQASRKTD